MKKLLLGAGFLALSLFGHAQDREFKPFKVDVSLGYAIPGGSGSKGGVIFAVEPKYALKDEIAIGLRIEGAVMARGTTYNNGSGADAEVKAAGSYLATGDYYFSKKTFRPFVGAGLGIYSIAGSSVSMGNSSTEIGGGSKFGGMIRAGFEAGHFRMGLEYNLVGSTKTAVVTQTQAYEATSKNGYFGIKVGVVFGGGRTK